MSATNLHRIVIEDCLAYFNQFESEGISAYEEGGDIYVAIRGFDIVQISKAEAVYRADMYLTQLAEDLEYRDLNFRADVWSPNFTF
jgi:hypothetical protein